MSDIDQQQSEAQRTRTSVMPVKQPVCLADPLAGIKTAPGKHKPTSRKHLFHRQIYGRQLLLSVDDDPINQMVVSNLLQPMGCRVQQAMNGHEALAVLEQATALPDLVLLDCMMPGMSGYSVCQYMRSRYGVSHLTLCCKLNMLKNVACANTQNLFAVCNDKCKHSRLCGVT